jgi:GDP/UDP-N,N'-diacetylbacillosamine 2-epimerase (hydrolysing)
MRKVLYITGTRADFGLMLRSLQAIERHTGLSLKVCVTGMHLSERFGLTVREVEASGLKIAARLRVDIDNDSGLGMALVAGDTLSAFARLLQNERPDVVLLLGDRIEMLAAAIAAVCQGIPIAHVHGGERSGTIDESLRHAISKLAHIHLVTTPDSRDRLLAMGERADATFVVGAPGLVGLQELATRSRGALLAEHGLGADRPTAAVLFHPVVQDAADSGAQMQALLTALTQGGYQAICLLPNADVGNSRIREVIECHCATHEGFKAVAHLQRGDYVSLLACCDVLAGNSSSGILEAASFGAPVVNIGDRQNLRERNANVFDCPPQLDAIIQALRRARDYSRSNTSNLYAQADTDQRIASILHSFPLDLALLKKSNTY